MDNFNFKKFLAEGKLHEAMSPQDVVDIADTVAEEFTKESAEEGDFLIYTVGRMEADDMSFELDTDASAQTPKDLDTRGVGEGWGGIFRIKPSADGYEVRNAEKGGLVAMIDNSGNFRMLSAAESRAEMGLEENKYNPDLDQDDEEVPMPMDDEGRPLGESKEETKSNKMKKSELKEMIKSAFLNEKETFDQAFDRIDKEKEVYPGSDKDSVKEGTWSVLPDRIPEFIKAVEQLKDEYHAVVGSDDVFNGLDNAISAAEELLMNTAEVGDMPGFEGTRDALDSLSIREEEEEDVEVNDEENVDVNVKDDVEVDVDDESVETDTVVKTELPGEDAEVTKTLGLLTKAQQTAKALGDDKLTDQIGNTITYFTRAHVARQQTDEVKVNEVTFPMWSKINK